jgi:4'-phosphopantetheinyl transferase
LPQPNGIDIADPATHHAERCPVHIWTLSLQVPRPLFLNPEEQTRANRFRFERDRVQWSHARSALREILARYCHARPMDLHFVAGEHGKPALEAVPGIEFNLSHSHGWAMIAVTCGVPVGIDLEAVRENVDIAKLLARIGETQLTGDTGELFHVWTRREARTKSLGVPLTDIPTADLRVVDIQAPPGFAASVALEGIHPEPVYRTERDAC